MDIVDLSSVGLNLITKACPPVIQSEDNEWRIPVKRSFTDVVRTARQDLCCRHTTRNSELKCRVMGVDAINTSYPRENGGLAGVGVSSTCSQPI